MINVTKTFLPPQEDYQHILKKAWDSGWMTNRGVLVQELEATLKAYLEVPNLIAMTNGTLPLQIAIKALGLKGEIITTPFSYVATVSSIVWEGCTPVFVDIDPTNFSIDETKIEAAITSNTTAILATHVFGNPCDVDAIETIANTYQLKVIYDAAHCFGVRYKGRSLFDYGDVSTCSFHATKVFHTGEGGALICKPEYFNKMFYHHNFGHDGPEAFQGLGINAKMSEPQAAMGLAVFPYFEHILQSRKQVVERYTSGFKNSGLQFMTVRNDTEWNYSYYPVVFESEAQLLKIRKRLQALSIFPRRYFYPSLETLPYVSSHHCKHALDISKRVLCLPLYAGLPDDDAIRIIDCVLASLNER